MRRTAVFDPTDPGRFNEQRQRFDWSLLQVGNVFRYGSRFQLDSASDRLTDLGYVVHRIEAHGWTSLEDMYDAFAQAMSYPRSYGIGLDALSDVFADVGTYYFGSDPETAGTVLSIAGFDALVRLDPRTARLVLDCFAREARLAGLYAHPMLCLVESAATDLGPVGGIDVSVGSVWDVEPAPPDPFHPGDLVEFTLQVYVPDPTEYAVGLRSILSQLLAPIGRWQTLGPTLISDPNSVRDARNNAASRPQPLPPDSKLWEFSIGIRGEGDHDQLADQLVHDHYNAGLHFEQMASTIHAAGAGGLAHALTGFPQLRE